MSNSTFEIKLTFNEKKIGAMAKKMIQTRTRLGRSIDSSVFENSVVDGRSINLVDSGNMLNSINVSSRKNIVSVTDGSSYGVYHDEGTATLPQREWFGLSTSEANTLSDFMVGELMKEDK